MTPAATPAARPSFFRAARALLLLHLLLTPLVFCTATAETFEENKAALLTLTALLLAGLGAAAFLRGPRAAVARLRLDPVLLGVWMLTLSAVVSTVTSVSPHTSWRGAPESHAGLRTVLGYLAVFLAARAAGRRLLVAAAAASAVATGYALVQLAGRDPLPWAGVSTYAGHARPFSTLGHANFLGGYLVMTLPLVAGLAERAFRRRRWLTLAGLTLVGVAAAGVALATLSRGAWLAGGCAGAVLAAGWWQAGRRRLSLVLAGALFLGVVGVAAGYAGGGRMVGGSFAQRLRSLDDGAGRRQVWGAAWELFRDRPLCGWGVDTFRLAFGQRRPVDYAAVEWNATPTRAHNELLHTLATQGLVGGVALLTLIVGLAAGARRAWARTAPADRPLLAGVLAGLVAFGVQGFVGFTVVSCGGLFAALAGLLSAWARPAEVEAEVSLTRGVRGVTLVVGAATAALVLAWVVQPWRASLACSAGDRRSAEARAFYQQAVALDPGDDRAWGRLSGALLREAHHAPTAAARRALLLRARQAQVRAVALVPADAYHRANLARVLGELAQNGLEPPAAACASWDHALAADPINPTFLAEASRGALTMGDKARAQSLAERGAQLYPFCAVLQARLASCAYTNGRVDEAKARIVGALRADWHGDQAEQAHALATLATAALALGHPAQAEAAARQAVALRPEWSAAQSILARTLHLTGRAAWVGGRRSRP